MQTNYAVLTFCDFKHHVANIVCYYRLSNVQSDMQIMAIVEYFKWCPWFLAMRLLYYCQLPPSVTVQHFKLKVILNELIIISAHSNRAALLVGNLIVSGRIHNIDQILSISYWFAKAWEVEFHILGVPKRNANYWRKSVARISKSSTYFSSQAHKFFTKYVFIILFLNLRSCFVFLRAENRVLCKVYIKVDLLK